MWFGGAAGQVNRRLITAFTKRTGISVHVIPASESASQRLQQVLSILRRAPSALDVVEIDTTWPPILAEFLSDLANEIRDQFADELPQLVENATVENRIIGAPFLVEYGMLYYRTDLLRKYGFARPPGSWSDLELQASRIQRGERAAGRKDFWGYVWQGAEYEGLTCNALEWQLSQGGGNFLEKQSINVTNPAALRAFSRAARWVGTISPPGVTAYLEEDSRNLWQSGNAAFLRSWAYVFPLAKDSPAAGGRFSVTPMPSGVNPHSSVIGGGYLGISRATRNRGDAIEFLKYMVSPEVQKQRAIQGGFLPTLRSVYRDPVVLNTGAVFATIPTIADRAIRRPVATAGAKYDRVSQAYAHGIHEILIGKTTSAKATGRIETALSQVLGFGTVVQRVRR